MVIAATLVVNYVSLVIEDIKPLDPFVKQVIDLNECIHFKLSQ